MSVKNEISIEDGQRLYDQVRKIPLRQLRCLIENARNDEARDFWQFVYNMNKKHHRNEAVYDILLNSDTPVSWWDTLEPFVNKIFDFGLIWDLYIGVHMGDYLVFGPYFTQKATQKERHDLYKKVEKIQHLATEAVSTVCRRCGRPGISRSEDGEISEVYCDTCYQEQCQDTEPGEPKVFGDAEKCWCDARSLPILRYYHRDPPGRMSYGTHGEVTITTTEEPAVCYHCEKPIETGSRAALFTVIEGCHEEGEEGDCFIMHENCAAWRCYREDVAKDNA